MPKMSPEEAQLVNHLTAQMTTRCVGRYLVDLPSRFVLNEVFETSFEINFKEVTITELRPMTRTQFDEELKVFRESMAGNMEGSGDTHLAFSQGEYRPRGADVGLIVDRTEDRHSAPLSRILDATVWKDGHLIRAWIKASNYRLHSTPRDEYTVPVSLEVLQSVLERLRGRSDLEIPTEPGVCFAGGFLRGPVNEDQHESLTIFHHLDGAPDVYLDTRHMSKLRESTTLLERGPQIESSLKESKGHTVRKGKSKAQIPGAEEWLRTAMHDFNKFPAQSFVMEANSKIGSQRTPYLTVDLSNGFFIPKHVEVKDQLEHSATLKPLPKATFNEAQVLALWDAIIPTLRPRPGAL